MTSQTGLPVKHFIHHLQVSFDADLSPEQGGGSVRKPEKGHNSETSSASLFEGFSRILATMSIRMKIYAAVIALSLCSYSITFGENKKAEDVSTLTREMVILQQAGRHAEALPLAIRALQLVEASVGPDNPTIAVYVDHLGVLYHALGETEKARQSFRRALEAQERILGMEHVAISTTLVHLAKLYVSLGDAVQAEPLLNRALMIRKKQLGAEAASLATVHAGLAAVTQALGRYGEAEQHFKRTLEIQVKSLGSQHPAVATVLEHYASLLLTMNRAGEAADLNARAQLIRAASSKGEP